MSVQLKNKSEKFIGLLIVGILLVGSMVYLGSYRYLFKKTTGVSAAVNTWDFDSSGGYTFDSARIEVTGGVARLVTVDQTDNDNTTLGFGGGINSDTQWDSSNSWLELDATGESNGLGNFTSRVIDSGTSVAWTTFGWTPRWPYFKELPDSAGADSGYATGTLSMTGNVGLWHLNESSWSGVAGEVIDSSGNANHCVRSGEANTITTGTLQNAGNFSTGGSNDFVNCGRASSLDFGTGDFTISAWFRTASNKAYNGIWGKGTWSSGAAHVSFATHGGYPGFSVGDGSTNFQVYPTDVLTTTVNDNLWHHYVVTVGRSTATSTTITPYIDGLPYSTARSQTLNGNGNVNSTTKDAFIGQAEGGNAFDGQIDEVAVFTRTIGADEVSHMYKRGALRLKHQVRSCSESNCSDGTFIGPDGTNSTYYTELTTSTAGLPSKTLVNISNNRYFQYKTYFEDDSSSYTPELSSISVSPAHYPGESPTIVNSNGTPFALVTGFTDSVVSGTVKYQASNNSSSWYYWDGSNWASASGYAQTNTAAEISRGLTKFPQQVGRGGFFFNAFLNSDGNQLTQLDTITLTRDTTETKERTIVISRIKSIKLGDGSGVTKTRDIPITIEGDNILRFKIETDKTKLFDNKQWIRYEDKDMPFMFTLPEGDGTKTLYFKFMSWDGGEINDFSKTIILTSAETVCTVPEMKRECAIPARSCAPGKGEESCLIPEWACSVPASVCSLPKKKDVGKDAGDGAFPVTSTPAQPTTSTRTTTVEPIKIEEAPISGLTKRPSSMEDLTAHFLVEGDVFMVSSTRKKLSTVYLYHDQLKRPFINDKVFFSWFESFEGAGLKRITQEELDAIPSGNAVPYKASSRLVKIKSSPKVYEVMEGGRLCHIVNEFKAVEKYGISWYKIVDDISAGSIFNTYHIDTKCEL